MKKITLLILLITSIGFSQTTLLDFESATTWTDFDGGVMTTETNPYNNADNNTANVGKMIKSAGQPWGGSWTQLASAIDFANNNTITMKVYSPRAGAKVLFKVENAADGNINFEKEVLTTVANTWETLTFDFSSINKSNTYEKIVIIFDNGTMGDGSANFTFHIDDITLTTAGGGGPTIALPLDFESATTWADFDGGALTTESNPHNNADNNSANVGKMVKNAGQTWGGSSLVLSSAIDFSSNDTFTMKVYSPRVGAKVLLKVENSGNSGINFEKEVLTTVANAWETLTFDYSAISKSDSYDKLVIIFDNGTMGDGSADFTFYIDDITLTTAGGGGPTIALPLDFESATTWADFDGGAVTTETNPHNNADNNSANVGKMVKSAGQPWGGSSLVLSSAIDFSSNDTFTMKVYSPRAGAKVLLKVENSGNAGTNFEKEVLTTAANAWETLTFDYSAISKSDSFDKLVIIFDNGTMGDGSANFTFYIDDITLTTAGGGGPTIALPLDFESATTWADFDGGALTTESNPHNNADNNSANVGKMVKSAGQPWGGSSLVLSSAIDFSSNDTFTMKVYSPRAGAKVLLKVENSGNAGTNFEKEVLTTAANAWETLTFDYSAISKSDSFDKLVIIFDNGTMGDGTANFTFYIDDIALSSSGGGSATNEYCEKVVTHFGIAAETASAIKLTIENTGTKTMKVTIESNDADPVDEIVIPAVTGAPTVSAKDTSVSGKISVTLTWTETPTTDLDFNVLWSKVSFAGNWQLSQDPIKIDFNASCATANVKNRELLGFSMYPNPASNRLNISAKETIKNAQIFNILGKNVMNINVNATKASIDVSNLTSGIYLIKYNVNGTAGTAKFIKQ